MMTTRFGVWLPLFDELADPRVVVRLAVTAEEAGWDGFFVWDQLAWRPPVREVADAWVSLAAVATATERIRFGPMVAPLARRRPVKLARETVTLDRLGRGRLILGVGVGEDRFAGEYSRTGEETDLRRRAERLDEALVILRAAWSGDPVRHHGQHYRVDDLQLLPRPENGSIPIWVAAMPGHARPLRRAARHDGFFPVNLRSPDQLAEAVATVQGLRSAESPPMEVAVEVAARQDHRDYVAAGATWIFTEVDPETLRLADVEGMIGDGPPR